MALYRPHRELLDESMADVVSVNSLEHLVEVMRESVIQWYPVNKLPTLANIRIEPYGFDKRIGWDTHIVTIDGEAWGFTNGPLERGGGNHARDGQD